MKTEFCSSGVVSSLGINYSLKISNFRSVFTPSSEPEVTLSDATLRIGVDEKQQPLDILFSASDNVTISPVRVCIDECESVSLSISFTDNTSNTVEILIATAAETHISFSIEIPPLPSLKLCETALGSQLTTDHHELIMDRYDGSDSKERIFAFLDEIGRWISLPQYIELTNELASIDENFKSVINTGPHRYFGKLLLENEEVSHTIDSPALMDEVLELRETLPELEPISFEPLLEKAINSIHTQNIEASSWEIVRRLRLTERDSSEISIPILTWVLSLYCLKNDWEMFENLLDRWIAPPDNNIDVSDQISEIKSMSYDDRPTAWFELIPAAQSSDLRTYRYVIASCFDSMAEMDSLPGVVRATLYETASLLFGSINLKEYERTAIYHSLVYRGIHFKKAGRYKDAIESHQRAFSFAMDERRENGEARFTSLGWAIVLLTESHIEQARAQGDFETAVNATEEQIERLDNIAANESGYETHQTRLQAWKHELTGDIQLQRREYNSAAESYGRAVGDLAKIEYDNQRDYLLRRKHAVQAAAAELRGEFKDAAAEHGQVQNIPNNSNHFGDFNTARKQICLAKDAILNFNLTEARREVSQVTHPTHAVAEAKNIDLLIDAIEDFEANKTSSMDLIKNLSTQTDVQDHDIGLRIDYGHEYDQTLVTVLAAQRLPRDNIDKQLLRQLIATSLKQLFTPTEVTREIQRSGLSEFSLENQWKERLPLHIRQELHRIESSEPNVFENYIQISLQLVRLVELFFEPLVDFSARKQWGDEFREEIEPPSELSLGSLKHILLDKQILDNEWGAELRDLFQEPCYETEGQEYTIVECRNRLVHGKSAHNPENISELSKKEYRRLKDHVNKIMRVVSTEYPCLGRVTGTDGMGKYRVELYRGGLREHVNVASDRDLTIDSVYYFPANLLSEIPRVDARGKKLIECTTERTLNKLPDSSSK